MSPRLYSKSHTEVRQRRNVKKSEKQREFKLFKLCTDFFIILGMGTTLLKDYGQLTPDESMAIMERVRAWTAIRPST